jgi:predicted transposase/invertase (TIGR01784 family)
VKTDTIFYHLFHAFPSIFFELIGRDSEDASQYHFTSVEIKELAFRQDGVFLPQPGVVDKPIYFAEVQFQKEQRFYARLCTEIFVYLYQHQPEVDWQAVVIYPRRSLDMGVPAHYRELFASGRIKRLYLDELAESEQQTVGVGVAQLVVEKPGEVTAAAKQLLARAQSEVVDPAVRKGLIDLIETIMVYKFPARSREEIATMLGLGELKQTRVYQDALEEGRQLGLQEGLEKGLEQGIRKGLLAGIELGLELRFGGEGLKLLPEIKKIEDMDILDAVHEGLKIVDSLEELRRIYEP